MKKLLLTGVPGWLTDALLYSLAVDPPAEVEEVRSLVLPGGRIPSLPTSRVRFSLYAGRLENPLDMAAATEGCDTVLHAAGLLHVRRTTDWYRVNTDGTRRIVEAAIQAGTQRFVFISTNAAAGRASCSDDLMSESAPPRPLSHYGRSKLLAEQIVLAAPFEGVVLRPCMFYGPPVPARHVEIYKRILTSRMPLIGHGNYARSLTHIDNLVQACRLALVHPKAIGQVYYIADEPVYTTRRVVEAMAAALDTSVQFWRLPALTAPMAYYGDRALAAAGIYWQTLHLVGEANWHVGVSIAKAQTELGYIPLVTLEAGMRRAIQWCRDHKLL